MANQVAARNLIQYALRHFSAPILTEPLRLVSILGQVEGAEHMLMPRASSKGTTSRAHELQTWAITKCVSRLVVVNGKPLHPAAPSVAFERSMRCFKELRSAVLQAACPKAKEGQQTLLQEALRRGFSLVEGMANEPFFLGDDLSIADVFDLYFVNLVRCGHLNGVSLSMGHFPNLNAIASRVMKMLSNECLEVDGYFPSKAQHKMPPTDSPCCTLRSFGPSALAEPLCLLMVLRGISFNGERWKSGSWACLGASAAWNKMPQLFTPDGEVLTGTVEIARLLSRLDIPDGQTLQPSEPRDALRAEWKLLDTEELYVKLRSTYSVQDDAQRRSVRRGLFSETGGCSSLLHRLEAGVCGSFLMGDSMSAADVSLACFLNLLRSGQVDGVTSDALLRYPKLLAVTTAAVSSKRFATSTLTELHFTPGSAFQGGRSMKRVCRPCQAHF